MNYSLTDYLDLPKVSGVYCIYCTKGSKVFYYGSSNNIYHRFKSGHMVDLRKKDHDNPWLQNVYNKYGQESFRVQIVYEGCEYRYEEQELIDIFYEHPQCCNLAPSVYLAGLSNRKECWAYSRPDFNGIQFNSKTELVDEGLTGGQLLGCNNDVYVSSTHVFSYTKLTEAKLVEVCAEFDKRAEQTEQNRLNVTSKIVYAYDEFNGELLITFPSSYAAKRFDIPNAGSNAEKHNIRHNFLLSRLELTEQEVLNLVDEYYQRQIDSEVKRRVAVNLKITKPVGQYDRQTGELLNTFQSARHAAQTIGKDSSQLSATCRGRYKTCGGYIWKYI